jgi:GNAT superfamily N-acetyltransferase
MSTIIIRSQEERRLYAKKVCAYDGEKVVGRAYVYVIFNDLHEAPYGLLEDVFVNESYRGRGVGGKLLEKAIAEAKECGCYKLIGTSRLSRTEVHEWYERLGFEKYGYEFRMNLV